MPQIQTVLTSHQSKSGSSQKGSWTMHIFTATDGSKYQTFDTALGNKAYGLLNQSVSLIFEPEQRGQYVNNTLKSVDGVAGGTPGLAFAPATTAAPVAPTQTAPATDDRQLQIMRQSALERAIRFYNAKGTDGQGFTTDDLYELADEFVEYFVSGRQSKTVAEAVAAVVPAAVADSTVADDGFPVGF